MNGDEFLNIMYLVDTENELNIVYRFFTIYLFYTKSVINDRFVRDVDRLYRERMSEIKGG